MFTNNVFNQISLNHFNSEQDFQNDLKVVVEININNNSQPLTKQISLEKFLSYQEEQLNSLNKSDLIEQIIEINYRDLDKISFGLKENEENQTFKVKTTKVIWNNNKESFMHVFIDTTGIRKLEEVKIKSNLQQRLFASASHEFRTPLNAFSNALNLLCISFKNLKGTLQRFIEEDSKLK